MENITREKQITLVQVTPIGEQGERIESQNFLAFLHGVFQDSEVLPPLKEGMVAEVRDFPSYQLERLDDGTWFKGEIGYDFFITSIHDTPEGQALMDSVHDADDSPSENIEPEKPEKDVVDNSDKPPADGDKKASGKQKEKPAPKKDANLPKEVQDAIAAEEKKKEEVKDEK